VEGNPVKPAKTLGRRLAALLTFLTVASTTLAVSSASAAAGDGAGVDNHVQPPTRTCDVRANWPSHLPGNPPSGWYYCDYGIASISHENRSYVAVVGGGNYGVWYTRRESGAWIPWQSLGGHARSSVRMVSDGSRLAAGVRGTDHENYCIWLDPRTGGWGVCDD
jgi:hypothetical protein